jgi:hypothetical protein
MTAKIVQADEKLTLLDGMNMIFGSVLYDPSMRWWRLRPSTGVAGIVGEYSSDGVVWSELGVLPAVVPESIAKVVIGAGTNSMQAAPREARFGQIDFCSAAPRI